MKSKFVSVLLLALLPSAHAQYVEYAARGHAGLPPSNLPARLFFNAAERTQLHTLTHLPAPVAPESTPQILQLQGIISSSNPQQRTAHRLLLKTSRPLAAQAWQVQAQQLRVSTANGIHRIKVGESFDLHKGQRISSALLNQAYQTRSPQEPRARSNLLANLNDVPSADAASMPEIFSEIFSEADQ